MFFKWSIMNSCPAPSIPSMTYYTPTPKLLSPEIAEQKSSGPKVTPHKTTLAEYSKEITDQLSGQVPAKSEGLPANLPALPRQNPVYAIPESGTGSTCITPPGHLWLPEGPVS
jgi:hypothetical protein